MADDIKKEIILVVKTDTTEAGAGVKKLTDDLEKVNETPIDKPFKSFKAELKAANEEVVKMADKFGVTSTEAANAARKVADLKDRIGDAKALSDTFNPDKKFVALGGALQGAVGGFTALQGVMGIFGGQSGNVEKALLKVQSAMALQEGISGIMGAVDSFQLLGSTIIKKVVTAFSTLKGAIATTGIGLLVIAIGFAVSKLIEWNDSTDEQITSEKELKIQEDLLTESIKKRNEEITKTIALNDYSTNLAIINAKARGASEKELYDITKKGLEENVYLLQEERDKAFASWNNALEGSKAKVEAEKVYRDALEKSQKAFQQYELLKAQGKLDELNRNKDAEEKNKKADEKEKERLKKLEDYKKELGIRARKMYLDALAQSNIDVANEFEHQISEEERQALLEKSYADAAVQLRQEKTAKILEDRQKAKDILFLASSVCFLPLVKLP